MVPKKSVIGRSVFFSFKLKPQFCFATHRGRKDVTWPDSDLVVELAWNKPSAYRRKWCRSTFSPFTWSSFGALRGERYKPQGICPSCGRKLTPTEIIAGFNRDPNDFTTRCTGCKTRFEPLLICFGKELRIELPFYCGSQTLAQMRGKQTLSPEQFAREHPAIYRSTIVHHGGVRRAFAEIGIQYPFEEMHDWRNKIRPFLGRLPDTVIAKCVDATPRAIGAMRRKLGIERYARRTALDETGARE